MEATQTRIPRHAYHLHPVTHGCTRRHHLGARPSSNSHQPPKPPTANKYTGISNSPPRNLIRRFLGRDILSPNQRRLPTLHRRLIRHLRQTTTTSPLPSFLLCRCTDLCFGQRLHDFIRRKKYPRDWGRRNHHSRPSNILRHHSIETATEILFLCARCLGNWYVCYSLSLHRVCY